MIPKPANTDVPFLKKYKSMRRLLIPLSIFFVLVFGVVFWWQSVIGAPQKQAEAQRFIITKGASASQIGNKLAEQGLVKSALAFKIYTQVTGTSKKIQSGQYSLAANRGLASIVSELLKGPQEIWVTVPEGLRREEIGERFAAAFELAGEEAGFFQSQFLATSQGKEGFLFPDTYLFPKEASASAVVNKMLTTLEARFDQKIEAAAQAQDLTKTQVLTLASLLERETVTAEERPIVAGILLKRWRAGWPLQVDASVQYAIGKPGNWWPRPLTKEDIAINSPFNTYKFASLPPTPIANPGLSSIKAVVDSETSPYWFYLHDTKGEIHYAATLEEHNLNIDKYLGR